MIYENQNQKWQQPNLKLILKEFLKFWLLYLLFIIFSFAIAIIYLKIASNTYQVDAIINIDTSRENSFENPNDFFDISGLLANEMNILNEISFLQSTPLIRSVIDELELRTFYYIQEDRVPKELSFSLQNINKDSPFLVYINKNHIQPISTYFYIQILDDSNFLIHGSNDKAKIYDYTNKAVIVSEADFTLSGKYKFGQTIENDYCSFVVLLNSNYDRALYIGKDLFFRFNDLDYLAKTFQKSLSIIEPQLESTIIEISFEGPNNELSLDFLTGLVNKYIETNLESKNHLANKTIEYINYQLSNISDSLGRSERQLQIFRKNYNVMDIGEKADNIASQLQTMEFTRDNAQTKLAYFTQMRDYFESNTGSSTILSPGSFDQEDRLLNNLIEELTSLNSEKQKIISNNQLRSTRLQTLNTSINNLENVIKENISFNITTTQNELNELNDRIKRLNNDFSKLPQTQRQLTGIERQFNINDAVYTSLLEKRIQAQIIKASNTSDCKIIEPPHSQGVASPNKLIIIILAIFFGFIIPTIYVLIKRFFSDRIHSIEEVKSNTKLPIIGEIPVSKSNTTNQVIEGPKNKTNEAFQLLRNDINFYLHGESGKVILVTSNLPNEGKSYISLNLASAFAVTHKKTILIECDLRTPSNMVKEFNIPLDQFGLSSFLIKNSKLEDILIKSVIPNLDIIPSGHIAPNPIELISKDLTANFINSLKESYDYIILDTPPYGLVSDAFILMDYSDVTLHINRIGIARKKLLNSISEKLNQKNIKNVFLVVNESESRDTAYSYEQYYYKKELKFSKRIKGLFSRKK